MTGPVRIVHVIDSLGLGGAEQSLLNLVKGLKRPNIEIVVVPLFKNHVLRPAFIEEGIEVADIRFGHKWNLLKNTWLLAKFLRDRQPQVVHAHLIFSGICTGLTKCLNVSIVRVISFHNLAYAKGCNTANLSYFLRKTLNWLVFRFCYDRFFAVSSAVAKHYEEHFGLEKTRVNVLPNGFPTDHYQQYNICKEAPGDSNKITIVALGRLVKEKGYEYLLEAFAELQSEVASELELIIVGGGPLKKSLGEQAKQLGVSQDVYFKGSIDHDAAMQELAKADLYVLSSVFEGFGLAVAEAVLLEKLVVATRVGGVLDIVDDSTAVLVDPGSTKTLTDGIKTALVMMPSEQNQKTEKAKQHVIERFSIKTVADDILDVYGQLLYKETGLSE